MPDVIALPEEPRLALSVRQPFADNIILGKKKIEYRTREVKMRGRVYIYASHTIEWEFVDERLRGNPPVHGKVIGSVEIVDCTFDDEYGYWHWHLRHPQRMEPRAPIRKAQPVFFRPW